MPAAPTSRVSLHSAARRVNAIFLPGSYVNRQYTILTATGGVSGTFDPTVISNMPNIHSTLSYDAQQRLPQHRARVSPAARAAPSTSTSRTSPMR